LSTDHQSEHSGAGNCHVTRQHCSIALAPKLSGTEKLLACHRPRLRRSFFQNSQRFGKLTCSEGPRFRPRWVQRGTDHQCWHSFPLSEKRQALLQHLARGWTSDI